MPEFDSMRTVVAVFMFVVAAVVSPTAHALDVPIESERPPAPVVEEAPVAPPVEAIAPAVDEVTPSQVPSGLAEAQWGALPDGAAEPTTVAVQDPGSEQEFTFRGRVMAGFAVRDRRPTNGQRGGAGTDYGFVLQQARLRAQLQPNKRLRIVVTADFADALDPTDLDPPPYLRNAYLQFAIEKRWLELRVGRFKRPYSRIELTSTGVLPMRGRGLANGLIVEQAEWGDRSVGVMLRGRVKPARVRWWLSATDPEWRVGADPQGVDLLARVTVDVHDALELGVGGGRKWTEDALGNGVTVMGGGVDARLRIEGFQLLTEVLVGQQAQVLGQPLSMGLVGIASYEIPLWKKLRLQPTLFGEWADADIEFSGDDAVRVVFGANLLWKKSFRVMPQLELIRPLGTVTTRNPWPASERFTLIFSAQL